MPYLLAAYSALSVFSLALIASIVWRRHKLQAELRALSQAVELEQDRMPSTPPRKPASGNDA